MRHHCLLSQRRLEFDSFAKNSDLHKEAAFIPEVVPQGDEVVIAKISSSPFNSTNIDFVLRNLGVVHIVLAGVMTNGCVESTARDAADRG